MELVSGKVWTERKIVVILNVTTIFALHEKRRERQQHDEGVDGVPEKETRAVQRHSDHLHLLFCEILAIYGVECGKIVHIL